MIGEAIAIAVRKPDGEIVLDKPVPPKTKLTKRFHPGSINLFRQMVTGVTALMDSAEFA